MRNHRKSLLILSLSFFGLTLIVTGVVRSSARPASPAPAPAVPINDTRQLSTPVSQDPIPEPVEDGTDKGIWLMFGPEGFAVREMTLTAGDYFVVIQNAAGLDQFSFRIEKDSRERIRDVRVEDRRRLWKQMVNLAPGRYVVSEVDHPEWATCVITVTR